MIGVIGPNDSVTLTRRVADELGLGGSILTRTYEIADEAPALARELDAVCQVLLFTGRVPYVQAKQAGNLQATLDFVPHGGIDLYRALVMVLAEREGRLPVVSLDTIDQRTAEETYLDLGLDPPAHILALEDADGGPSTRAAADVVAFHAELYASGQVELCLTCLGSVGTSLERLMIPVLRIEHTRAALREALTRASLIARLARTEATQTAVAVLDFSRLRRPASAVSFYDAQRAELRDRQQVLDLAERLKGVVADSNDPTFVIHTTRGAIEGELARIQVGGSRALLPGQSDATAVGFGVGDTTASAQENAHRALALHRSSGEIHIVLEDGSVILVGAHRPSTTFQLRETDPRILATAREIGIGTLTLSRLVNALRQLDPGAVTARDLARAYGFSSRSALRLLAELERAGVAVAFGTQVAPRAGRPQIVYRVDLERLLPSG